MVQMFDKRLEQFRDIHKGERAFVTACGPSLNDIDVSLLKDELVFGVSRAYKKEGLDIDYHFMGDMTIAEQFYAEIVEENKKVKNSWFVSDSILHRFFRNNPNFHWFVGHGKKTFHTDVTRRIYGGGTSTFLAMQFAYFMGIVRLYVLGLDHYKSYKEKGLNVSQFGGRFNPTGQPLVMSGGPDEHHFSDDYYGKGVVFYTPTVWKMEESYKMARRAFEADDREIYNASTETALSNSVLTRVDFYGIV